MNTEVDKLFTEQFAAWQQARDNYDALKGVKSRSFDIDGAHVKVQFNPARIVSTAAKVDTKSIGERKCFLCKANRPVVQDGIEWNGDYTVLINPFPIFNKHLTIPCNDHTPQRINNRIIDMLSLAKALSDYTLFYNGPRCGASAPDHMHFQAGNKGFMPIECDMNSWDKTVVAETDDAKLLQVDSPLYSFYLVTGDNQGSISALFNMIMKALPVNEEAGEAMLNILCNYDAKAGKWNLIVVPRVKHRPDCYFADGDAKLLISPASVDMGGVLITPVEADFNKITKEHIRNLFKEVCYDKDSLRKITSKI